MHAPKRACDVRYQRHGCPCNRRLHRREAAGRAGSLTRPGSTPDLIAAWDAWHRERDALEQRNELPEHAVWRELALGVLPDLAGCSTLDCGSARGGFARALADRGAHVTAVDSSPVAVGLTQRLLAGAGEVIRADARSLPIESSSFDVVVCLQTLNYVAEWRQVIAELVRVARPGGRLVVAILNGRSPLGASRALQARLGRSVRAPGERTLSSGSVVRALQSAGAQIDIVVGDGHAVALPGLPTIGLGGLRRFPGAERIAFHVCVAGRVA